MVALQDIFRGTVSRSCSFRIPILLIGINRDDNVSVLAECDDSNVNKKIPEHSRRKLQGFCMVIEDSYIAL